MVVSELADFFKATIRYYYSEFRYNEHWGGIPIKELLSNKNPIIDMKRVLAAQALAKRTMEFDLDSFFDELTSPAYPTTPEDGVRLYWGHDTNGRGAYYHSLQQAPSKELSILQEKLLTINYHALEDEWLEKLRPFVNLLSRKIRPGLTLYRARIGISDEALRFDEKNGDEAEPVEVVFPYTGDLIGPPKCSKATAGRLDRANLSFLYMADNLSTAIAEVRPHPGHRVSVGKFTCKRVISIANLAKVELFPFATSDERLDAFVLFRNIEHIFAMPVLPDDPEGYLLTQFLAEIFRRLGFGGVSYRSSVADGINYAVFDPTSFSYLEGSGTAREIDAVHYTFHEPHIEFTRSTDPNVTYYPKRKRLLRR